MLSEIEQKILLSLITRLCQDSSNYFNSEFGSRNNKIYIDGCIEYLNKKEKAIVKKWIKENNISDFKEEEQ